MLLLRLSVCCWGIDVKYYVVTDFQGFERIIDTLGGVTVDVEQGMYHGAEGIHIDPGIQRLNGHDALGFVRYRDYPLQDIDRIKHQQVFFRGTCR
jgi:LCP family protein required for cell wall assembly